MRLSFFIARRYFLSKGKKNFINIISLISMGGVAFATAALIIVLSVFNGLELLLRSLYTSFDPELKVELVKGKSFEVNPSLLAQISAIPGVKTVTEVIEDYAYVRYRNADMVVTLKGVSDNFLDQHRLDDRIVEGELKLRKDSIPFAIIGRGVRYTLSADPSDETAALRVFYIKNLKAGSIDPSRMYSQKSIRPGSVFQIEKTYDENYIFVPIDFAQSLFESGTKRTALEIQTAAASVGDVQTQLRNILGDRFNVLTNDEQHKDFFRLLNLEKFFFFFSFSILLLVGAINIFFSLMMLAIDKKKDISILTALGARPALIKQVFFLEGSIISLFGAGAGLILGAILCWLQDKIGLVSMGMVNAVVEYYPVSMRLADFLLTSIVIVGITFIISFRPAILAARSYSINHL